MYQNLVFVGNLGKDPEMRYTQDGKPVTSLSVCSTRKYTSGGQKHEEKTWFRVSVFGAMAEPCSEYLKKGSPVLVEGRLSPDKETGSPRVFERPDGTSGASYEVLASTVIFLPNPKSGSSKAKADESEDTGEEEVLF